MKVAVWGWQFQNEYPGEAGVTTDDSQLPISEYWGKTNDGLNWQSVYDNHAVEFKDIASVVRAEREIYGAQGIEFKPWGVVRGQQPGWSGTDYATREGTLAGQIAKAATVAGERAVYIVDLEPYYHGGSTPQFWRNDLGAGPAHVRAFIAAFTAAGGQELFIAPDARAGHLDPVSFRTWIESPVVTLIMPQVYWTDFKRTPQASLDTAKSELAKFNVHPARIVAVTPGNGSAADMKAGIEHAHAIGFRGVSVWRRGTTTKAVYDAIASMNDPWWQPVKTPSVPSTDGPTKVQVGTALELIKEAKGRLEAAEKLLGA